MLSPRFRVVLLSAIVELYGLDFAPAADGPIGLPIKAPAIARSFDWSGWYVGGHAGYSRGSASSSLLDPAPSSLSQPFGALYGGVQFGYNYLLPWRLLFGFEGDFSFPNFLEANDITVARTTTRGSTITERLDYVGRLRGRLGYALDRSLIYGTGGFAWSQARFIESPGIGTDDNKILRTRTGWTLGAGAEVAIAQDWTARLEYLYDQFGRTAAVMPSGTVVESNSSLHNLRLGLNRKLGLPGGDAPLDIAGSLFPLDSGNWNIHGQLTVIGQGYRHFRSPYEGTNSLSGANQFRNTGSATAFIGIRAWEGGEFYLNPELMQGFGLSDVHGVAAFPNGEAQKSNFPVPRFNMARLFVRQTFGLGGEQETLEDGPNQIVGKQDISRITVTVGKFAVPDFFGGNSYANDPRTTFLNWNIYGNGSYDWTMDKLSWTWGAVAELNQKHWAFRVGYFLVPTESNSNYYDPHVPERGEYAAELELRYSLLSMPGKLRFFGWVNRAIMGGYADTVALPITSPNYPDIILTRRIRTNYGVVVGAEQAITDDLGVFSRASWSPGTVEIIGWTDVSNSLSLGAVLKGTAWGRPNDKIALAGVSQGLSRDARAYFAAGGLGILIGDGQLNYRRELAIESYYAFGLNKHTTLTFDYQMITNPGYNTDRGPVSIYSTRLHWER
jgi:high affinity Mn2+ porin